jgi:tight adherence protein B
MSTLPLVGLLMAAGLGIDVVGTLVGTPFGWALLSGGAALLLAGGAWTARLVRSAASRVPAPNAAFDMMAVALSGGLSVSMARHVVEEASQRTGLDLGDARLLDRILQLAERAGAPIVELLASSSRQERRSARITGRSAATTLSVRLLLPLGACILPAFLLLGVAPVILAMISSTFAGLT